MELEEPPQRGQPKNLVNFTGQAICLGLVLACSSVCRAEVGDVESKADSTVPASAVRRELIRDPHFQGGFYLLEPKPGKRVAYGELPGLKPGKPIWDLAQWSSRFPLQTNDYSISRGNLISSNNAKRILVGEPGSAAADLSLGLNAAIEYGHARKSSSEPWVHLLVQQDFVEPPALGSLAACNLHFEARLKRSHLLTTNNYSPDLHAAQFFLYLTVANRNPATAGFGECFWFGVPVYDDRHRMVPAYEAQDFGETRLFICTPGSDNYTSKSTHDRQWITFERDLLPLIRQGLEHARAKGFIKGSYALEDFHPLGIFIGWEVPGMFDVELQMRNLSLVAVAR